MRSLERFLHLRQWRPLQSVQTCSSLHQESSQKWIPKMEFYCSSNNQKDSPKLLYLEEFITTKGQLIWATITIRIAIRVLSRQSWLGVSIAFEFNQISSKMQRRIRLLDHLWQLRMGESVLFLQILRLRIKICNG